MPRGGIFRRGRSGVPGSRCELTPPPPLAPPQQQRTPRRSGRRAAAPRGKRLSREALAAQAASSRAVRQRGERRASLSVAHLGREARLRGDCVGCGEEGDLPEVVAGHRRELVEPLGRHGHVRLRPWERGQSKEE